MSVIIAKLLYGHTTVIHVAIQILIYNLLTVLFPARPPPAEKITDLRFLDKANYFLGHAIIAYAS